MKDYLIRYVFFHQFNFEIHPMSRFLFWKLMQISNVFASSKTSESSFHPCCINCY